MVQQVALPKLPIIDFGTPAFTIALSVNSKSKTILIEQLIEQKLEKIKSVTQSDKAILFVDGSSSFRKKLTANKYKGNRTTPTPETLSTVKSILIEKYDAIMTDEIEADDAVAITHEHYKTNYNVCYCSVDKDLKQLPGWSLRLPFKSANFIWEYVSEEKAINNLIKQLLKGDSTDNVKGLKGIGDKKADQIIKNLELLSNNQKIFEIINLFRTKDNFLNGINNFTETYQMIFLKREPCYGFTIPEFKEWKV